MSNDVSITVLVDNDDAEGYCSEWGFSLLIRRGPTTVLYDFGQSDAFARNAARLDINLARVDCAVLSHAHYDHADGMEAFFGINAHARLFLSDVCAENCWSTSGGTKDPHYIGIRPGLLERYGNRIVRVPTTHSYAVASGIHIIPHSTPGLEEKGARDGMLLREEDGWQPDGFAHEVSLVVELGDDEDAPLAVLNSCSHAGLEAIVHEVSDAFPQRHIAAFVGGLHLLRSSKAEILSAARLARSAMIMRIYTGHCTGEGALETLSAELPERVFPLCPGLIITGHQMLA